MAIEPKTLIIIKYNEHFKENNKSVIKLYIMAKKTKLFS